MTRQDTVGGHWQLVKPGNEPPFLFRQTQPNDGIDGYDPLTGNMIAHSIEDAVRIDAALKTAGGRE